MSNPKFSWIKEKLSTFDAALTEDATFTPFVLEYFNLEEKQMFRVVRYSFSGLKPDISVTQFPKSIRLKGITNQFPFVYLFPNVIVYHEMYLSNEFLMNIPNDINTLSYPSKNNSNTIELTCYWGRRLTLCYN